MTKEISVFTHELLENVGIAAGDYVLVEATDKALAGNLVLAESAGRKFFGIFTPKHYGASFTLPGREIVAREYKILARIQKVASYL